MHGLEGIVVEVTERGECGHACEQQLGQCDGGGGMLEALDGHDVMPIGEHAGHGVGQPEEGGHSATAVDATEVGEEEGARVSEGCEWEEAAEDEDGDGEEEAEEELTTAGHEGQDVGHGDERGVGTGGREVAGDGGRETSEVDREAEKEEALVDGEPAAVRGGNAGECRELSLVIVGGGGGGDGSRFEVGGECRRDGEGMLVVVVMVVVMVDVNARMVGTRFLVMDMVVVIKCDWGYS